MLYAGLDLSRKRLDVHVLREEGTGALVTAVAPDADALRTLARRVAAEGEPVRATIESMNGARFVHDSLEFTGWDVLIADAQRVRGLAPLAAKTDKIDARVLAELTRRALVPEIWLSTPEVRQERERARFRLHLVRHQSALKNRVSSSLGQTSFSDYKSTAATISANGAHVSGDINQQSRSPCSPAASRAAPPAGRPSTRRARA